MKLLVLTVTLLAGAWAQSLSGDYLPPVEESSNIVETNFLENEPAHSLADDGYRYRTVRRYRLRRRRDVSELSNDYLPPHAGAASETSFESAPAPAAESYEVEASAPAHTLADDGYRYRTVKRYRLRRRRRDVSELSNDYLPPHAGAASETSFESAPAPAAESYDVEASAPAHTLADDGYRYRTVKRYRIRRRRRDVSELSNDYLPPHAGAASETSFESAPAPGAESYEVEASAPAHTLADDGYRYRTVKRYRLRRRRRDVSELSNDYLPPHAASASEPAYDSAPAPAAESYDVEASAPAHTLADDGYRYRTVKRYRIRRRRRDVSELSNDYLPPHAGAASETSFESAPAPAAESYEVEASAPAHTLADDGYRYRTVKRYRLRRRRRDVSELSNDYLPPHATAASEPAYDSAPAPAAESYEVEASAPAHTLADDGYRYRTVKRYRIRRRRRDVSELSNDYLPPHAGAASETSFESAPAPAAESYEVEASAPAHTLADDGYRYRTVKRYRIRRRRRDVSELSNDYLPPHVASGSAPAFESAPAPAAESYEVEASAPAHTLANDGYRYRTVKRFRLRRRF